MIEKSNFNWKEFEVHKRLGREELAQNLGISTSSLSNYVRGKYAPLKIMKKLDDLYGKEYIDKFLITTVF